MKQLHLLRHAKSAWDDPALEDHERGLNARGRRDAPRMGAALAARLDPLSIVHSSARRATLTLGGLSEGWPQLSSFGHHRESALYTFSYVELLSWLESQDDGRETLFLIGHNPAFTDLANCLLGRREFDNIPTAGYVQLTLDVSNWSEIGAGSARGVDHLFPKELNC